MCIVMLGLHCPATSEKRCPWYMNVSLAIQEMTVRLPVFVDWFPFAVELQQLWGSATEAAPDAKMDAADAKVDAAGSCLSRWFDDNFLHSDTGTQDKLDVHRLIQMNSFAFSSSTKHNNLQAFPLALIVQLSTCQFGSYARLWNCRRKSGSKARWFQSQHISAELPSYNDLNTWWCMILFWFGVVCAVWDTERIVLNDLVEVLRCSCLFSTYCMS